MDDARRVVREGYDRIARRYEAWGDHGDVRRRYVGLLRDTVPAGERAVDLGCGTGGHGTALLTDRYRVVGVDASPVSVALARSALPAAGFVVADMGDVSFRPGSLGAVTALFSLIHVPRAEHAAVLAAVRSWLRPGGVLVVTMGAGDGEDGVGSFLGTPMYWSTWSRAENLRLVEAVGFRVRAAADETEEEDGVAVAHLWVVADAA